MNRRILLAASAILVSAALHFSWDAFRRPAPWTNADNALILFIAEEMDAGGRLYVDWRDAAWPAIFFFALGAVRLAGEQIPSVLAYNVLVLGVAAAGLHVLVRALRTAGRPEVAVQCAAAGYLLFVLRPGSLTQDFGQRDHLFALLMVPELFALHSPWRPRWRPAWCAALAFAASQKPHFAAIVLVAAAAAPRAAWPRRIDVAGYVAGACAPIAMLYVHSPESVPAFMNEISRLHLSGVYASLNQSPVRVLHRGPLIVIGAALAAGAVMAAAAARERSLAGFAWRGSALMLLALLTVVHQGKYLPYHFAPLFGMAVVWGGWSVGEWLNVRVGSRAAFASALAAAVVLAGALAFHAAVAANGGTPMAVRLGMVLGSDARLLVVSVYSHDLCTPFRLAPRCVGPDTQDPELSLAARAPDGAALRRWVDATGRRVREHRPEILVLSSSDAALPAGMSPAALLLESFRVVSGEEYVRLSPETDTFVRGRGQWIVLRRRDVPERLP